MQSELNATGRGTEISILGVNGIGWEAGNGDITSGRELPWLQDTDNDRVWERWAVAYRDVIILDDENRKVGVYNLTDRGLSNPGNYAELKGLLLAAAGR